MYIGIDAGTSVVKAVVFDCAGSVLKVASRRTSTFALNPGESEQHLGEVLKAVGETIGELLPTIGSHPALLAVTAHGDGLWLLDADGHSIRPGILWSDARSSWKVQEWQRNGIADRAFRANGNVPFSGSQAAILSHFARHERLILERATTAAYCKDAINQALTGARSTDPSDASLPFMNHNTGTYDQGLLDDFGLADWRHLLPPIDPTPGPLRLLTNAGSFITGLLPGTPVHAGPFDFPATTIGAGVDTPGDGLIALGTTLACGVIVDRVDTTGVPSGMTIALPQDNRWVRLLPAMAGTMALDWILPLLSVVPGDLENMLSDSRPGAGGVMMLPFISPSGERAPFVDAAARGSMVGLNVTTTKNDIARAVCEGIAYAARHCLESAGLNTAGTVSLCGGGSRSDEIGRILANVLGRPVNVARQPETGARGAVMAAMISAGIAFDRDIWTAPEKTISPDPAVRDLYDLGFQFYLDAIERARGHWSSPSIR